VISSGHGKYIRGASGYIDEVDEARKVVNRVADYLAMGGGEVTIFHDNVSTTQGENLDRIVDFHNAQGPHDLDVSVHFNAYETTEKPMGTECLYVSESELASRVSDAVSRAGGFINRGPKKRTDLAFLNGTNEPAILIETCFVDSKKDVDLYHKSYDEICQSIAEELMDKAIVGLPPSGVKPPQPGEVPEEALFYAKGKCSYFGGPDDMGVTEDEGLAFIYDYDDAPHLFLPEQPDNTSGLARRLNERVFYIACRWDYDVTSKSALLNASYQALVRANGKEFLAWPADWGPHKDTGRVADLSPGLMEALGVSTDDEVEVIYPA
jgi:N-acetylmuramoyl-L-alanine amidase